MSALVRQAGICHIFTVFAALACFAQQPTSRRLILLDGSTAPVQAFEITAEKLRGESIPADLTLDDLRQIELRSVTASTDKPAVIAELRGGGRIFAKSALIRDDKCQLAWPGSEQLSLPLDLIRALRFDPADISLDFEKALAAPSAQFDRVFLTDDTGRLSSSSGLVDSLSDEQLSFEIGGQKSSIPRQRLHGIVVAQPVATDAPPRCLVTFTDGSKLGGEALRLINGAATLSFLSGSQADFRWESVANVRIRSNRLAYLSEWKAIVEEQQPIVTLPRVAQRDKSVIGQPLTLGTRVYEKGLGVHARSLLTFAAEKKWDLFAATIGLDAAGGGNGDCVFTVLADGQPLVSRRMRGGDGPYEIQVPIAGREQITLLVEPGEGLDLADQADWCDARLIKNRP